MTTVITLISQILQIHLLLFQVGIQAVMYFTINERLTQIKGSGVVRLMNESKRILIKKN